MAVKPIITVPDPVLRQVSSPVAVWDKKLTQLVADMIETARAAADPEGVGLSAVQIGVLKRVFVVKLDADFTEFINPEITAASKKMFSDTQEKDKRFMEGCLSIPNYYALVDRPHRVTLRWQNLKGETLSRDFEGKYSSYVQHELDHLNAVLFTDRAVAQKQKIYKLEKNEKGEEELVEIKLV